MKNRNNRKIRWLAGLAAGLMALGGGGFQAGARLEAAERSPELIFSTYLGGSRSETSVAIERDLIGRLHVAGTTSSEDFPRVNTSRYFGPYNRSDVFLSTFSGERLTYSSFFNFPGEVSRLDLATWGPNLYLVGYGYNTDFTLGFADRSSIWDHWERGSTSRFFPTSNFFEISEYWLDYFQSEVVTAATDDEGNLYVVGKASYFDGEHKFRTPMVVAKLTLDLEPIWISALDDGERHSQTVAIAVDGAGNAYVAGFTRFTGFPTTEGAFQTAPGGGGDGFVLKLGPTGATEYLTYLGGSGADGITDIAVSSDGSAVVAGWTSSADFPVRDAIQSSLSGSSDSFVAKLTPDGSSLVFSTFLGGSGSEGISAVRLLPSGPVFVAGTTQSADYPQVRPVPRSCAPSPRLCGPSDAFVTELAPDGSAIVFSSLLGGSGGESGTGLTANARYEIAVTGSTSSPDFPLVNPVQETLGGGSDVFVAELKVPNKAPDCSSARVSPSVLWPPDGRLVPVSIAVPDPDGDPVTVRVYSITQDEPLSGAAPDAAGVGTPDVLVRADRLGGGDGRVYRIGFDARDSLGAMCHGVVNVCVPHDRRPGAECKDSGGRYSSVP